MEHSRDSALTPPRDRTGQWWARTRRKGMLAFVVLYGLLGWGVGTGSLWMLGMWLFADGFEPAADIWHTIYTFALGGLCFGLALWSLMELKHRRWSGRP